MYSWNYGQNQTKRLVNVFRPTVSHPYQILDVPGINNPGPKYFGYYITDDFGNMVCVGHAWHQNPFYFN